MYVNEIRAGGGGGGGGGNHPCDRPNTSGEGESRPNQYKWGEGGRLVTA